MVRDDDLSEIAIDVDFEPYLDAVTDASQRARSTLYVLVVALIAIFAAYRNTLNPDWIDTRLQQLQIAEACFTGAAGNDPRCGDATRYARQFVYHPSQRGPEPPFVRTTAAAPTPTPLNQREPEPRRELHEAIDLLMRQRTDNLSVRLPLLGLVMDMNDMGLISGVALFVVLYIFGLTLTREGDNLSRAKRKAASLNNKDNFELLLMAQVFSAPTRQKKSSQKTPRRKKGHQKPGTSRWFNIFFLLPAGLYGLVVFEDAGRHLSREAGRLLIGQTLFNVQIGAEVLLFGLILGFSARAWLQWRDNARLLAAIQQTHDEWPARRSARS